MRIDTVQGMARAIERLARRDPKSLAAFIVSLAHDAGPIGDQVRTMIVGDDVTDATESIKERIGSLHIPSESDYGRRRGEEIDERLGFILDSIETLVLPVDARKAFELLIVVFQADAAAIENCGDHEYEVTSAFERATELIASAARSLQHREVEAALQPLILDDDYGVRAGLSEVISRRREEG
ncbi:MAG: hypothetical protein ACLQJ0_20005 [Steroidobacteraceae bacterium]|jgi:hypothetical protein